MALIKFGGGIIEMRGSIGGTVFSRNRSGAIARARIAPVNPRTDRQSEARAITAMVTTLWVESLTQDQRDAWAVFATNVPAKNKLGEVIHLSGFNQFVKSNNVAKNAGFAEILNSPTFFFLPGEDPDYTSEVDAGTGKITIVFDDTRPWTGESGAGLIVQMGIPVSQGVNFFDGPWRSVGVIEGNTAIPITSPDANLDVAYPVADAQRVFTRAKVLRADGRVSDWFRGESIVGTA